MKKKIKLLYDVHGEHNGAAGEVIEVLAEWAEKAIKVGIAVADGEKPTK